MRETLKLYMDNGLCGTIDIPADLGNKKSDYEIIYFFTHKDVWDWAGSSEKDKNGNKDKYLALHKSNPEGFRNEQII